MRLDKLRGSGPWLAYASPACLVAGIASFALGVQANLHVLLGLAIVLVGLWMLTMLAVAIDLEWIEHPLTNTGMTYVALGGAVIATVAWLVILASSPFNISDGLAGVLAFGWMGGLGVYLVVINVVGRRAQLLKHGLSWVGVVTGALFLVGALLIAVGLLAATGFPVMPAVLLYNVWSVWLGFVLRGKLPAKTMLAASA